MDLDPGTIAIIQLAWSRGLGLDDGALADADANERIYHVTAEPRQVSFVRLFGREVFCGPEWAADYVRSKSLTELTRGSTLIRLSHDVGGRALGTELLYFADTFPTLFPAEDYAVGEDPLLVSALERLCPPDDVSEAGLSARDSVFTLVDDSAGEERVLSGAGYSLSEGILADMSVLTAPSVRCRGLGSYISAVAVEDAMAAGLIPQWRVESGNVGAARTAVSSGFIAAGLRASVALPAA